MTSDDARLARLTEIARALPQATREDSGRHATFRVRKRVFAYFLDDHHDDGIVGLVCKPRWENEALIAADPGRFYMPAYLGPRGWIGVRLDTGDIDWAEVEDFVADSYLRTAPKRLAAQVEDVRSDADR